MTQMSKTTSCKAGFQTFVLDNKSSQMCLDRWVGDTTQPSGEYIAFYHTRENKTIGFALIRKCDMDSFEEHLNPWLIELVYVHSTYRRQ
jgi:hypothetical protein